MLALIQRVSRADVSVSGQCIAKIGKGLLVLLGVERDDSRLEADKLLKKVLAYRVFADLEGKMNLSLQDIGGGLLVVSQFTLAATTDKGLRPGFSSAKPPAEAEQLYNYFVEQARNAHSAAHAGEVNGREVNGGEVKGGEEKGSAVNGCMVQCGSFGADMQVALVNDGPVTFLLKA